MIRKLERWVWIAGAALALNGGIINAVGLSCAAHQTISHVTGTTTLVALAFGRGDFATLARLAPLLGAFIGGAVLAGIIVENSALQFGRHYALALWVETGLVAAAAATIGGRTVVALTFAAAACGLQNAIASTYSGAVLRTTHMTGIVTDLGATFGHCLRGCPVDWLRVRLYLTLLGAFIVGAGLGGWLFVAIGFRTFFVAAALTASLAASYSLALYLRRKE
jgi:uncharacterized membrane protein YoaK (UPF0700 family)